MTKNEYLESLKKKEPDAPAPAPTYDELLNKVKELEKKVSETRGATHTIDEVVPPEKREEVQAKIDKGEIPHNPWSEEQFKAIMANTDDPAKRAKYAKEQEGK